MADSAGRKPPGVSWESWVEAAIREGMERGEFDGLAGQGKPIAGIDGEHDELWWVKDKLRREGVSYLPPTLAIRKDRDDTLEAIRAIPSERTVREILEELNRRIRYINSHATSGPPSTLMPLDMDAAIERWRADRGNGEHPA